MMQHRTVKVLVNGISAKGGGGVSILSNFLRVAGQAQDGFHYVVAVPDASRFADLAGPRVTLISVGKWSQNALILLSSILLLPYLMRRLGCDMLFNLGDVPVMTHRPQVFLFDWSYAAFPESPAWRRASSRERLARRVKLFSFRALLPFVNRMIAQSEPLALRLQAIYGLREIDVVPNAVSLENLDGGEARNFALGDGFKLLCLSRYYSHKNIEIFLPVARRIRDSGINAKIITTLAKDENDGAKRFLDAVDAEGLATVVINVGPVPMPQVPSLYRQSDALLLPTLLESFSGTYVEAMHHGIPILTSDLDFAHGVCRDAAFYFDPIDDEAIVDTINKVIDDPELRASKVNLSKELLAGMPDWEDAYFLFTKAFSTIIEKKS